MSPSGGHWALPLVLGLWAAWLAVRCAERRSLPRFLAGVRGVWASWPPSAKGLMAALLLCCTLDAQKPARVGGGGASAPSAEVSRTPDGGEPLVPLRDGASAALPGEAPPAAQPQSLSGEPSGPCRVVFQSTPASDPRAEAAFGGEPGWGWAGLTAAAPGLDAVSFAGDAADTPPPLRFGAETAAIRALMLVSRGEPADLATLVDGAAAFRLRLAPDGGPAPDAGAAEGALTAQFLPGRWQVVTLGLAEPAGPAGLFFGGSAGRPEWRRNWRGEIAEIVGFDAPPDADVRAGVANYLAVRWGFGGHPATPGQRQAAVDAGLRYGLVWGSVLFVK